MSFVLQSSAFADGTSIPRRYTCDGDGISPPLAWYGAPETSVGFALIMDDPDAPGGVFTHWVLYDLPATVDRLPAGIPALDYLPSGAVHGRNDYQELGYGPPCPPAGPPHHYHLHLYALDAMTGLDAGASRPEVLAAIEGHVRGDAQLNGLYQRRAAVAL